MNTATEIRPTRKAAWAYPPAFPRFEKHAPPVKWSHSRVVQAVAALALTAGLQSQAQSIYEPYTFTTIAGKAGILGMANGTNSAARFNYPSQVAVDDAGNLYVADLDNNTIRKLTPTGTNWVVTTVAGKPGVAGGVDGTNSAARFDGPDGVVLDGAGNLYVTDWRGCTVRKVAPVGTNWVVTTLAGKEAQFGSTDGVGSAARFFAPNGLAIDRAGNLYVADGGNNTVRKVAPLGTNWVVTTLAGKAGVAGGADGTNTVASFTNPAGPALDAAGNLYLADNGADNAIRKLTPVGTNWVVATLAGKAGGHGDVDGPGSIAHFDLPTNVAVDTAGNIFVTEYYGTVRKLTPNGSDWTVTTLAGTAGVSGSADGTGATVRFNQPQGIAIDSAGSLYVADASNQTIRKGYPALVMTSPGLTTGLTGSQFGFALTGPAAGRVVIDASTDLIIWLPIWTNILTGPLSFTDSQSDTYSTRFYRARRE